MKSFTASLCLLAAVPSVLGHAIFQQLWVDDVDQVSTCVRMPASNSPIENAASAAMTCNSAGPVPGLCAVDAGSKVTVEMHQHNDRDCTKEAVGGNHFGPVIVYMSKVTDATTADGSGKWFKVSEDGYDPVTKLWGERHLNADCGKHHFKVPTDIATGDYLIRAELIALHAAGGPNGAQFYMSCYQVHVEGTGTATPAGVSIPGAYSATDPGILINIYQTIDDYIIPGPELYVAGGASGPAPAPSAPAPSSSAAPVIPSSTVVAPVPTTLAPIASTTAPAATTTAAASTTIAPIASSTEAALPTTTEAALPSTTAAPTTTAPSVPEPTPIEEEEDCEEL